MGKHGDKQKQQRKHAYHRAKNLKKGANRRGLVRKNGKWVAWWRD